MMTSDFSVLISDHTWPSLDIERSILSAVGARIVEPKSQSEGHIVEAAAGVDAILTCFATIPSAAIRQSSRLQVVGRYGIGVDNIAVAEATSQGVLVTNVPDYCIDEVATHTLALILNLTRGISRFERGVRSGNWSLLQAGPLRRLRGSMLGIVGFGSIGREVATKALGLGLRVTAYDPHCTEEVALSLGVELQPLNMLLSNSDFVTLHTPLTPQTTHLVNASFLRRMRSTAYLINAARGGLVDQTALCKALSQGWIAGAGIDVVTPERLEPDDPLLQAPNCVVTPHVAFYSEDALVELQHRAATSVAEVLSSRRPVNVVNPSVLELPRWSHLVGDA
jgi:D-3-phosphoglycerate dehydrogenase / 2-oxoglutarate reductase